MSKSVFAAVRKAVRRCQKMPAKAFLTELFAWMLRDADGCGPAYVDLLVDYLRSRTLVLCAPEKGADIDVLTQASVSAVVLIC